MRIGFDYWQVISHYPKEIATLMSSLDLKMGFLSDTPWHIHVISAIGHNRIGTIQEKVDAALAPFVNRKFYQVHEVIFDDPKQSPELKLAKCRELGIEMFFDDRDDVCRLLNQNGILVCVLLAKITAPTISKLSKSTKPRMEKLKRLR